MDRTTLTVIASIALLVAVILGWGLRWTWGLLNPPAPPPAPEPKADSEWAQYAQACEAERDAAQAQLAEMETDLNNRMTQLRAELDAAMDGLRDARLRADTLEDERNALQALLEETTAPEDPEQAVGSDTNADEETETQTG